MTLPAARFGRLQPAEGSTDELEPYRLPDGTPLWLFHVLAHSPAAFADLRAATARVIKATSLTPRQRELIILRVLDRRGASAEVAVHLELFGSETGLDARMLRDLSSPASELNGLERDLVRLADRVSVENGEIDDVLWLRLLSALGPAGLVDALFVATQYVKVGLLTRALRIPVHMTKDDDDR